MYAMIALRAACGEWRLRVEKKVEKVGYQQGRHKKSIVVKLVASM